MARSIACLCTIDKALPQSEDANAASERTSKTAACSASCRWPARPVRFRRWPHHAREQQHDPDVGPARNAAIIASIFTSPRPERIHALGHQTTPAARPAARPRRCRTDETRDSRRPARLKRIPATMPKYFKDWEPERPMPSPAAPRAAPKHQPRCQFESTRAESWSGEASSMTLARRRPRRSPFHVT